MSHPTNDKIYDDMRDREEMKMSLSDYRQEVNHTRAMTEAHNRLSAKPVQIDKIKSISFFSWFIKRLIKKCVSL